MKTFYKKEFRFGEAVSRPETGFYLPDAFNLTLSVEKTLSNGAGLARMPSGEILFLPRTLPGDLVIPTVFTKKKGVTWAEAYRLLEPSPGRRIPPCPHAADCGGCNLLHAEEALENQIKREFVQDNLRRIAGLDAVTLNLSNFRYEASRIRGKMHATDQGRLGFKTHRSNDIIPIDPCMVIPKQVNDHLAGLGEAIKAGGFSGSIFFLSDNHQVAYTLRGTCLREQPLIQGLHALNKVTGFELIQKGKKPKSFHQPWIDFHWNAWRVELRPQQFCQSNMEAWPWFWGQVVRFLKLTKPHLVWDAHAGAGFLSSAMESCRIIATEPEKGAFKILSRQLRQTGKAHLAIHSTAEEAIESQRERFQQVAAAILDPPRTGLEKPLRRYLIAHGPPHLLYFSCDVASFARDLGALKQAYDLETPVEVANQTPGTLKLETAARLTRR